MNPDELLHRIAQTLKQEIGPAIDAAYPKTQAFMAAVVLEKLARQLELAPAHAARDKVDTDALVADLNEISPLAELPVAVQAATESLRTHFDRTALNTLVEALYANRDALGQALFARLLGRLRQTLRANIDRQMQYAA